MAGLDQFYSDLTTTDTKKKITIGTNIINYLEDDANSIECEDIGGFIDGLVPWMQSSNFKVTGAFPPKQRIPAVLESCYDHQHQSDQIAGIQTLKLVINFIESVVAAAIRLV